MLTPRQCAIQQALYRLRIDFRQMLAQKFDQPTHHNFGIDFACSRQHILTV